MTFLWPIAFLLLLPLLVNHFRRPFRSRTVNVIRLVLYLLLVLALAAPLLRVADRNGVAVVLVDRSRSMPQESIREVSEAIRRMQQAMPAGSRLGVISFAGDTVIEKLPDAPAFEEFAGRLANPDNTDPAAGLEMALGLIPAGSPARIMLFSDGIWTGGDPSRAFAGAAARNIAIDYRKLGRSRIHDLAIADISAPLSVREGAFFTIHCRIVSPDDREAACRIRRGDGSWQTRQLSLKRGSNFLSWRDRGDSAGVIDYTFEIAGGENDEVPENNRARFLVEVTGRKPLLLLTRSPSGNLARVLREAKLEVVSRPPSPSELKPEKLASYAGVILENVPASSLGLDGMQTLDSMVRAGSLGLLMTGGRNSFATGGYYRSPLEELLPVSLEQRQELRKGTLALMVTLDRSGSMAAPIGNMTKMDMANLATIEVLDILNPGDEFGVHAVDSSVHEILPLQAVSSQNNAANRIRRIESMGGGIFTYTALKEALKELRRSKAEIRHLLLFADAADAEEPGSYKELLRQAEEEKITVSVVGLGTRRDSDAVFLEDIARRGKGEVYFSDRAEELPRIFAQDTFLVARKTFIDTPVAADYTQALRSLTHLNLGNGSEFGGYNLCYPKDGCEIAMTSRDEFTAPIVAFGQATLGRAAVLTAEADGEYTGKFAQDPAAGSLLAALANWMLVPESSGKDYLVTQELENGVHRVEIHLNPDRASDPWRSLPQVTTVINRPGKEPETRRDPVVWVTPDRLEFSMALEGEAVVISSVAMEGARALPLAPVTLPYSPEYRPQEGDSMFPAIEELCRSTGGRERFVPDELWNELPTHRVLFDPVPLLLVLATLLLLLEVLERRTAILSSRRRGGASKPKPAKETPRKKKTVKKKEAVPEQPVKTEEKTVAEEPDSLSEALRRARRRR